MKHVLFPSDGAADAFLQALGQHGLAAVDAGYAPVADADQAVAEGTVEDAAAGAVKGTGAGVIVGAVAGTVLAVASGGLAAIPLILGMAALGSGVGAGVGAVGGATGVDETGNGYLVDDEVYASHARVTQQGGRVVALHDSVADRPEIHDLAAQYGGMVHGFSASAGQAAEHAAHEVQDAAHGALRGAGNVAHAAGDTLHAAGNKVEEGADRLRAAGHEVAAAVTGNPKHDALAADDRAKAEHNNAQAHAELDEAKRRV